MRYRMNRISKFAISCGILLFVSGFSSFALAGSEDRNIAIDRAIGGMEEGSRILPPEASGKETVSQMSGKVLSPAMDTRAISSPAADKGLTSPGMQSGAATGSAISGIGQAETEKIGSPLDTGAGAGTEIGETPTGGGGSGPGVEESSGTASSPIIDVDAGADLSSGTIEAEVGLDTSGELEERQILDADLGVGDAGSAEAEVGSATDITQQEIVESADITTGPIESVISAPADISAQVDTTGKTVGGETDIGVEADVSGVGAGDDVASDPADGLSGL